MSRVMKDQLGVMRRGLVVQGRVIFALLIREILTRYGRHNIGFLWLFIEPMLFTLGVTALWTVMKATHGSNLPIVAFAITGYSSVLLWRNMPGRCIGAIIPNLSLLYHRQVKIIDVFIARIALEALGATASFMVLSLVFITIGWLEPPEDLLQVIGGWLLLAWFGSALALLLGAVAEQSEVVDKLWHPLSYLLFPLSGAAFIMDALPEAGRYWVGFLPMIHGVEYLREGFFGSAFRAHYDLPYLIIFCMVLTMAGLAQTIKLGNVVVPE